MKDTVITGFCDKFDSEGSPCIQMYVNICFKKQVIDSSTDLKNTVLFLISDNYSDNVFEGTGLTCMIVFKM